MKRYEAKHVRDCLLAEARLCEHLAAASWDEAAAQRLRQMAKECLDAAQSALDLPAYDAHGS